jgi:hypothetical protein
MLHPRARVSCPRSIWRSWPWVSRDSHRNRCPHIALHEWPASGPTIRDLVGTLRAAWGRALPVVRPVHCFPVPMRRGTPRRNVKSRTGATRTTGTTRWTRVQMMAIHFRSHVAVWRCQLTETYGCSWWISGQSTRIPRMCRWRAIKLTPPIMDRPLCWI